MNVVADKASTDPAAEVDFAIADLAGAQAVRRAFVVGKCRPRRSAIDAKNQF
jgi:hypothetical protein